MPDWAVKWEVPLGFWEWFLLPVWRLRYALPGFQTDPRLACGIISAFILLGKRLSSRSSPHETAWCVFFLGTYVLWLVGFRTATSSIVLELAGVVLLGRCLTWLLGSRAGVLAGAVLLWMAFAPVVSQERLGLEDRNFAFFKEPVLSDNALVLLSGHVSGWAVFFPQDARFAGGVWFDPQDYDPSKEFFLHRLNPLPSGYYSHKRDNGVRQAVLSHQGAVYVLLPKENLTDSRSVWRRYGVEVAQPLSACQTLYPANLVEAKEFLLCRAHTLATEK